MAIFGVQVVISMIVASFLHKISPYFSVGRGLIIYRLRRYQTPSDTLLRPHVSVPPANSRGGGSGGTGGSSGGRKKVASQRAPSSTTEATLADIREILNLKNLTTVGGLDQSLAVPKSANIKLQDAQVRSRDLTNLHFSAQLEWMINLSLAAVVVYAITLAYYTLMPHAMQSEYNLSTIWLLLVCGYIVKVLANLTKFYFSGELANQRAIGIVFIMFFFVCSLTILLIDEDVLDFGLTKSHKDISVCVARLLGSIHNQTEGESGDHVLPLWAFKIGLAVCATLLSSVLIFSGFRFGDMHFNAIRYSVPKKTLLQTVLHTCYVAPMFCLSLWIRPLSHDVIAERNNVSLFGITEVSYDNFRFGIIVSVCLLRLIMYSTYMQSFLDTAKWRVLNLRREQGRITIKDLRERVSTIFEYYPATGVHYLAPFLILFLLTLLLHMSSMSLTAQSIRGSDNAAKIILEGTVNMFKFSGFGISIFHGCISFISWWLCFSISVTSAVGPIIRECF